MSTTIDIHKAKTRFLELLDRVAQGEEIVIIKAGEPVARLVATARPPAGRKPGSTRGTLWISDDFYDPLPEEIQKHFEN